MSRRRRSPSPFEQPVLFAPPPRSNRSRTSRAAAEGIKPKAPSIRERIRTWLLVNCFLGSELDGATMEEISAAMGIRLATVNGRIHELGELGQARALARTRPTSSGSEALVFVAAECVGDRPLEPWPVPRIDWKNRALAAERRAAELEQRLLALGESP